MSINIKMKRMLNLKEKEDCKKKKTIIRDYISLYYYIIILLYYYNKF